MFDLQNSGQLQTGLSDPSLLDPAYIFFWFVFLLPNENMLRATLEAFSCCFHSSFCSSSLHPATSNNRNDFLLHPLTYFGNFPRCSCLLLLQMIMYLFQTSPEDHDSPCFCASLVSLLCLVHRGHFIILISKTSHLMND